MTELEQLLQRSGHRPASRGKNWICVHCPDGHAPALVVKDDRFFCYRCGKGGNLFTLKRDLGLLKNEPKPTQDEALEQHCQALLHAEAKRILKDEQMKLTLRHCYLVQQLQGLNKIGLHQCQTESGPDEALLIQAHELSEERDSIKRQLNLLLNSKPEDWYHIAEDELTWGL